MNFFLKAWISSTMFPPTHLREHVTVGRTISVQDLILRCVWGVSVALHCSIVLLPCVYACAHSLLWVASGSCQLSVWPTGLWSARQANKAHMCWHMQHGTDFHTTGFGLTDLNISPHVASYFTCCKMNCQHGWLMTVINHELQRATVIRLEGHSRSVVLS